MSDFRKLARDPKHRRTFEKLLYLAAQKGDVDLVAERLSWGIDPNCRGAHHRTPLMANVRGSCPNVATLQVLLKHGADPNRMDDKGLTALDYARRKLALIQSHPVRPARKSPSLDENNQLQLSPEEQAHLDAMRRELGESAQDFFRMYWKERLRAARKVFNDGGEVEQIVDLLEAFPAR